MTSNTKLLMGMLLLSLIGLMNIPSLSVAGYWVQDDYGAYNDSRLINALREIHNEDNSYSRVGISSPKNINIKALCSYYHHESYAYFIYDTGHGLPGQDRLGYENVNGFTIYKITFKWTLNGKFQPNGNSETYIKIKYEAYYTEGSDLYVLSSWTHDLTNLFTGPNYLLENYYLTDTLTGYNAVQGHDLYVRITFMIHAKYDIGQLYNVRGGDFYNDVRVVSLNYVGFEHYVDTSGSGPH